MGQKITQSLEREEWTLTTPADMSECFEELVGHEDYPGVFRGAVHAEWVEKAVAGVDDDPPTVEAVAHWYLEVNYGDRPSVVAQVGQVVVLFGGLLEAMDTDVYATRFGPSPAKAEPAKASRTKKT